MAKLYPVIQQVLAEEKLSKAKRVKIAKKAAEARWKKS